MEKDNRESRQGSGACKYVSLQLFVLLFSLRGFVSPSVTLSFAPPSHVNMTAEKQHPGRIGLASVFLRTSKSLFHDGTCLLVAEARANYWTVLTVSTRLVTSPFKGSNGAPTYYKDVLASGFRAQLRNLTLEQSAYLNPSTEEAYLAACKIVVISPDSIALPSGVKAHWIGKRNAEKLIVYL